MGELTTQNAVEVFGAGDPDIRTTQNAVEVLGSSNPDIRTTQNAVEVLGSSTPDIRTTQNAVEVLGSSNPDIRVTQIAIEVIGPVEAPPPPEPGFGYGHNFAFHAFHDTGPTNNAIPHDTPLNQYTTTKGIGLRRSSFKAFPPPGSPIPPPPPPAPPCFRSGFALYIGGTLFNPSFVVPPGITSLYAECVGAGGDGDTCLGGDDMDAGIGGGAGAYAASLLSVTPGDILTVSPDPPNGGSSSEVIGLVSAESASFTAGGLAANSTGDTTIDGQDGYDGTPYPATGDGGSGGSSVYGPGGLGGIPNPSGVGGNGLPGPSFGSGGGGGGYGDSGGCGAGGAGAPGIVKLTWCWGYGFGPNPPHQQHDTGPTNNPISHDTPLSQYTTTKGIGMRRKWILGVEPPPPPIPFVMPILNTIRACNCPPYLPPPEPPMDFMAIQDDEQDVELTWTDDPDVISYNIYRGNDPGEETLLVSGVSTPYLDTPLTCGQTYYYYITAVGPSGEGPPSPEIEIYVCCTFTDCCAECFDDIDATTYINLLYGCPVSGSGIGLSISNCQGAVTATVYCLGGNWFVDVHQAGESGPSPIETFAMSGTCSPLNITTGTQLFLGGPYGNSSIEIEVIET